MKTYFTYLARCRDNSLYAGSTQNIEERERQHNNGRGGHYTRAHRPVKIVYYEEFDTRREAIRREIELKGWTKIKKESLIAYKHPAQG